MKTNRKSNSILAGALLMLVLMGPSMTLSKNAAASNEDAAASQPSQPERLKVAAVGTTGFGFSDAASGLKMTVDQVLEIVTDENLKKDEQSRTLALRKVIGQRFDFNKMAMHTLANVWDRRSNKERKQFTILVLMKA